jgi:tetratricopeptide (TPR) repeat protein
MANESTAVPDAGSQGDPGQRPLSAGERTRLTQCYNRGAQALDGKPPNLDYAIEMFSFCVVGDPASAVYIQSLLGALKLKHGAKKSGGLSSLFGGGGAKGSLKKLLAKGQWREALKQGVDLLKGSPHDQHCLLAMAEACGSIGLQEAQAVYLRAALDAAPLDPDVNRQCAAFAAGQGQFDQAIECYRRVARVKGLAEEAEREIARLSVEKTITAGKGLVGRQPAEKPTASATAGEPAAAPAPTAEDRVTALRHQIRDQPAVIEPYLELADLLERAASIDEAEKVLATALAASGNDLKIQEHVEDRHLRWARHKVLLAEKRLEEGESPEARSLVDRLRAEQLRREIDIYGSRAARYPENVVWKYELAMRLKSAGNHAEAIRHFQEVLQDPRRKGAVSLELGECFQKIKQYELAMRNYETAVELLTEREADQRKRALYRAGVLASGLGDVDSARKHLSTLAGLDFGYRDVAARLDKLGAGGDNKEVGEP